jgi:type IV secretion system protein TrbL
MPSIPFADFGLKWFQDIVKKVTEWFAHEITAGYEQLRQGFFGTPLPEGTGTEVVFRQPAASDEPWRGIYDAVVGGEVMMLALILLFVAVQGRHFVRIFDFSSAYEERQTRRAAWTGAVLIVAWYWVAVVVLYLVEGFTIALIPDLSRLGAALVDILPASALNPGITLIMAILGAVAMLALKALYFIREVLLYVYLYTMPLGIAVAFGNIPVVSGIARRLCRQFIPLAVLPLPAILLFRGYGLLFVGDQVVTPGSDFLEYLVVISLPLLALYVTWKTFHYAAPLTARALSRGTKAAATIGSVAGIGYVGGGRAALTTARYGRTAGAVQAATDGGRRRSSEAGGTKQDNVAEDEGSGGGGGGGVPSYRRAENDPAYY